jgi:hypothetical protein
LERNLGKEKDVGDPTFSIYKKNKFSCVGDVFPLDRGLLMGDPNNGFNERRSCLAAGRLIFGCVT